MYMYIFRMVCQKLCQNMCQGGDHSHEAISNFWWSMIIDGARRIHRLWTDAHAIFYHSRANAPTNQHDAWLDQSFFSSTADDSVAAAWFSFSAATASSSLAAAAALSAVVAAKCSLTKLHRKHAEAGLTVLKTMESYFPSKNGRSKAFSTSLPCLLAMATIAVFHFCAKVLILNRASADTSSLRWIARRSFGHVMSSCNFLASSSNFSSLQGEAGRTGFGSVNLLKMVHPRDICFSRWNLATLANPWDICVRYSNCHHCWFFSNSFCQQELFAAKGPSANHPIEFLFWLQPWFPLTFPSKQTFPRQEKEWRLMLPWPHLTWEWQNWMIVSNASNLNIWFLSVSSWQKWIQQKESGSALQLEVGFLIILEGPTLSVK